LSEIQLVFCHENPSFEFAEKGEPWGCFEVYLAATKFLDSPRRLEDDQVRVLVLFGSVLVSGLVVSNERSVCACFSLGIRGKVDGGV
jgi:hypothetical protein